MAVREGYNDFFFDLRKKIFFSIATGFSYPHLTQTEFFYILHKVL